MCGDPLTMSLALEPAAESKATRYATQQFTGLEINSLRGGGLKWMGDQVKTKKCDDDLEAAYRHGGVIGMWQTARGGDADHALLDAARALGFLTDEYHDRLSRVCFGSGTKQQLGGALQRLRQ